MQTASTIERPDPARFMLTTTCVPIIPAHNCLREVGDVKLKDYPGIVDWPPMPGGAYSPYQQFPTDERSVVVTRVFPVVSEFVTFTCEFSGRQNTYDLQVEDTNTARELGRILSECVGKTLADFGVVPLEY
jgi:hypothetical protein